MASLLPNIDTDKIEIIQDDEEFRQKMHQFDELFGELIRYDSNIYYTYPLQNALFMMLTTQYQQPYNFVFKPMKAIVKFTKALPNRAANPEDLNKIVDASTEAWNMFCLFPQLNHPDNYRPFMEMFIQVLEYLYQQDQVQPFYSALPHDKNLLLRQPRENEYDSWMLLIDWLYHNVKFLDFIRVVGKCMPLHDHAFILSYAGDVNVVREWVMRCYHEFIENPYDTRITNIAENPINDVFWFRRTFAQMTNIVQLMEKTHNDIRKVVKMVWEDDLKYCIHYNRKMFKPAERRVIEGFFKPLVGDDI